MDFNSSSSGGAVRGLNRALADLAKSNKKLASGLRINSASDDPAGLAVADALNSEAVSLGAAQRNVSDGQSVAQIADSALESISGISSRLNELATQAANGTLSDSQRASLNQEYQSLKQELDRTAQTTSFNGVQLLNGGSSIQIQSGTDSSAASQSTVTTPNAAAFSSSLPSDISSVENARTAIDSTKSLISNVASARGTIGANEAALNTVSGNISSRKENVEAAESRIRDADVASEVAERARASILADANSAFAAQAGKLNAKIVQALLT